MHVTHNLDSVIRGADRFSSQVPFAVASALTGTAKDIQRAMPDEMEDELDRPTRFTKQGFYVSPARKDRWVAVVGVMPKQAEYLRYQVYGGARAPKRKALRLPVTAALDQHGNLPRGLIQQLIARAQQGKRATKTHARRFGVSQQLDLFYGDPGDGRPPGIYKRVVVSSTKHQLVPVVVMPATEATYRPRFSFHARAERIAVRAFPRRLDAAWALALRTAR